MILNPFIILELG